MAFRFLRQSLVTASVITISANVLGRLFGYVREAAIANYFGTTEILDIFILAFTIPELIASIFFAALPSALLPALRKIPASSDNGDRQAFWTGMISLSGLLAAISILVLLFRQPLFDWLGPQFTGSQFMEGKRLLSILSLFVFFRGTEAYSRSWLFEKKHFMVPALSSVVMNIIILAVLLILYGTVDIEALAIGWLASSVMISIYSFVFVLYVIRPGFPPIMNWRWAKILLSSLLAVVFLESISMMYPMIDRYLAARWLGIGQIAALRYASVLIQIPIGIFVVALNIAVFPWVSEFVSDNSTDRLRNLYLKGVNLLIYFMGFVAMGTIIFANDIVGLAFRRGAFDLESLALTAGPLFYYAIGVMFMAIYVFQMRFYYARRALLRLGVILTTMLGVKIIASLALIDSMKHEGLALATSVAWIAGMVVMSVDLAPALKMSLNKRQNFSIASVILSLAATSLLWLTIKDLWPVCQDCSFVVRCLHLLLIFFLGMSLYVGLAIILKIQQQFYAAELILRKIRSFWKGV